MSAATTLVMLAATLAVAGLVVFMLRSQWQSVARQRQHDPRILAEHVVDKVSTHAADGSFRYVSSAFAGMLGEYPGTLRGSAPSSFAHPDDTAAVEALWKRALQLNGGAAMLTWRCRRHDGGYAWLETSARKAIGESAELGEIVSASRDVTERKQIEDALRESEHRFRGTLEAVRLVAVGLDTEGRVTFCNDALTTLTGWSRAQLLGENWFNRCVPRDDPSRQMFFEHIQRGNVPPKYESELICRDGTLRTIEWDTTVLRAPGGHVAGTASLGADVTARREYEARILHARDAAEAASRAKSDFLSRMSHELRTPLNSVIGFANVLRKNKSGHLSADEIAFLERIIANGQHLLTIVNDVLDIAKVEAGRLTVTQGIVAVDRLVEDVVQQLEGQPRGAGVELRVEVPGDTLPIETDGVLLRQVLINLTGNALKFTQQGNVVVSLVADAQGRPIRITVRDTGIGIAPDRLTAVFEPFEQAESGTQRTYGGTGLGLSISKAICDALGFRLTVESVFGQGSAFTVHLDAGAEARTTGVSNRDRTVLSGDTPAPPANAVASAKAQG